MTRMNRINEISSQLDNDPNYVFESLEDTLHVIGYRYAGNKIASRERQRLFNEKIGVKVVKPGKFWKQCKPGVKAIKPVNLSDT